jgi:anaerobic magnesium-protoporphyrin IX monomethyl ester cyclase
MKTDILLVHPNASHKIYQDLSKDFSAIEPPIWAAMIAKYLDLKGVSVEILDCEALKLNIDDSAKLIKAINPKIVAIVVYGQQPSASTQNMVGATLLMERIADFSKVRIYVGAHPSSLPKRTLTDDPGSFVCQGEGPKTLEELNKVTDFSDDNQLSKVPGLWYYNSQNKIANNPQAPLILNLDEEMPEMAWDLLPIKSYRTANWHSWTNGNEKQPFASLYTSLGCPFKCSFCMINSPFNDGNIKNNTFRHWSPQHVIKTFDKLADLGFTNIKIADEMFVYKPAHFLELCKLIIERGYKFNIWAYARIDTIRDSYLETLKKAGVNWLGLGIESANQVVRQEVTKGKFQDLNIREIVSKISDYDICSGGNFIFGLPKDDYDSMNQTLELALDLKTEYANFYSAMAYPGSQLHRDFSSSDPQALPENNGIGWIGYSQHAYETFNLPTEKLKNHEILKFRDEAFLKYFTNKAYIDKMTKKFGAPFEQEMTKMLSVKLNRKIYNQ